MTAGNPTLRVAYGTIDDGHNTPIIGNVNSATLATLVFVTLSEDYLRNPDSGYPNPEPGVAVTGALTNSPTTIPNGTRCALYSDEAAALVAANAATLS